MRPGKELPLLIRISIDRVLEQVGPNAAVVQQACCPCRGRRSPRRSYRRGGPRSGSPAARHFVSFTWRGEATVGLRACRSRGALAARAPGTRSDTGVAAGVPCSARRGAASLRGLAAPRHRRLSAVGARARCSRSGTRSRRSARGRWCRTGSPSISRMQVRQLHRHDALRREQVRMPADEVVQVRHVSQHVVGDSRSAWLRRRPARRPVAPEEFARPSRSPARARRRDVGRRLDPERGNAACDDVLEQVAVVAGDLDRRGSRARCRSARRPSARTCARARPKSRSRRRNRRTR